MRALDGGSFRSATEISITGTVLAIRATFGSDGLGAHPRTRQEAENGSVPVESRSSGGDAKENVNLTNLLIY